MIALIIRRKNLWPNDLTILATFRIPMPSLWAVSIAQIRKEHSLWGWLCHQATKLVALRLDSLSSIIIIRYHSPSSIIVYRHLSSAVSVSSRINFSSSSRLDLVIFLCVFFLATASTRLYKFKVSLTLCLNRTLKVSSLKLSKCPYGACHDPMEKPTWKQLALVTTRLFCYQSQKTIITTLSILSTPPTPLIPSKLSMPSMPSMCQMLCITTNEKQRGQLGAKFPHKQHKTLIDGAISLNNSTTRTSPSQICVTPISKCPDSYVRLSSTKHHPIIRSFTTGYPRWVV